MTIERTRIRVHPKPWGVTDLRPWSVSSLDAGPIGELSFERSDESAAPAALLLKLLFTSAPLSIQVHPDDDYAKSINLPNGKSEAWYVLNAAPGANVALGLLKSVTRVQLRSAIYDGSIAQLVRWHDVKAGDVISVPAGTIHAIGAGLVIAEIQQRSDATFRLFDHGRTRSLHPDDGAAAAALGVAANHAGPAKLTRERRLLTANAHFVFEHVVLAAGSTWCLEAARETWLLVLDGNARLTAFDIARGDAMFAQAENVEIRVGQNGISCLVAYTGGDGPAAHLLHPIDDGSAEAAPQHGTERDPTNLIGTSP